MTGRWLQRQASLLAYLTSRDAIFGDGGQCACGPELERIDPALLHLEAAFSHDKRMAKIATVLPRTFEILGAAHDAAVRAFVEACPATDIDRLANARQFFDFLVPHWSGHGAHGVPYLCDVAGCEFACAAVLADAETHAEDAAAAGSRNMIRRARGVVLRRCAYDVRPIFEAGAHPVPVKRDTPLAIAIPLGASRPTICELAPAAFDLLSALDRWADPASFGASPAFEQLSADLVAHGLLEVSA